MIPEKFKYVVLIRHSAEHEDSEYSGEPDCAHYFYFNSDGILCETTYSNFTYVAENPGMRGEELYLLKRTESILDDLFSLFYVQGSDFGIDRVLKLVSKYCNYSNICTTYNDFLEYVKVFKKRTTEKLNKLSERNNYRGLDRFVTRIDPPYFERLPGNNDKNTFDFIKLNIFVINEWPDKKEYLKRNLDEIKKMAVKKLKTSKKFQSFGIPINFLKLTALTLTKDDRLEFVFELKELQTSDDDVN